jgi:outer membrane protein OmpA-like peptidoglycan-associated protein
MKRVVIIGLVVLINLSGIAQSKLDLKNANQFYKEGEYYNAIVSYEVYLGIRNPIKSFSPYTLKRKINSNVIDSTPRALSILSTSNLVTSELAWQLGESYRQLYHFQRAEPCYARLIASNSTANYPLARYWYGVCLRSNNKFNEAEKQFNLFLGENKKNVENTNLANKELLTLAYIKEQLKKADPSLSYNKLKGNVSQVEGAYAPIVYNDTLLFTSARIVDTVNKYSSTNEHVNHLFYNTVANDNSVVGNATIIHFPSRLSQNEGTASLTSDKKKLYFSRSIEEGGKTISSIYVSNKLSNGNWSEPIKLDGRINKTGYNSIQPSVTQDNKYLLFASDREGGVGKFDIWYSAIDASGNLGEPMNLKSINTKDDDEAPFYHVKSHNLVFASKGYLGLGGFDLFAANGDIPNLNTPVNLGYPTNSPKDDIYFFSDSKDSLLKKSYVSSDRASDCCLELFAVNKIYKIKHKQSIQGVVNDCDGNTPLSNVSVSVSNSPNIFTLATTPSGTFSVTVADSVTGFSVSKDGYVAKEIPFSIVKDAYSDTVYKVLACLDKVPVVKKDTAAVIDSVNVSEKPLIVYFDFNKSDLKEQYYAVLDQVVTILKQYPTISLSLSINGYTDAIGTDEYNLKLGQRRAESCKQYILGKGIDENRLVVKSYGKATPAASNTTEDNKDNPEGRALNRRVELSVKAEKSK